MKIGIVGALDWPVVPAAVPIIENLLSQTVDPNADNVIMTKLADVGMNYLIHRWAWKHAFRIEGIAPRSVWEHPVWMASETSIVGSDWGDENYKFIHECDAIVKISDDTLSNKQFEQASATGLQVVDHTQAIEQLLARSVGSMLNLGE